MEMENSFKGKKRNKNEDLEDNFGHGGFSKNKDYRKRKENSEKDVFIDFKTQLKSEKFEFYYKNQLAQYFKDDNEFESFLDKLREKLPSVFRINVSNPFWKEFRDNLLESKYQQKYLGNDDQIDIKVKNLTNIQDFNNLVFNMDISKNDLKRKEQLTKFHKFIQGNVDSGLISRQEAVSMIPPMIMQPKTNQYIFDMCAAPGSKTAQFLEIFYKNFNFLDKKSIENDTGFILANEISADRAFLMTHQLQRLNCAGMLVINNDAQSFPTIYSDNGERILFDNILCDVPCSSDAVLRKLPQKWRSWTPRDSFSLHKLQLLILKRGISLLKTGSCILYSTCSLNPIENEAVVTEVLRTYKGCLELVNISEFFKGSDVVARNGLTYWKIYTEDKEDNKTLIEVKDKNDPKFKENSNIIDPTVFPEDEETMRNIYKTQNCCRIFPHDSDTSGFFITLIRKINPITYGSDKGGKNKNLAKESKEINFVSEKPEIVNWLKNYYGISDDFPFEQLVTQSKIDKKINFVSKGVLNFLKADKRNQMTLIACGIRLFSYNKFKNGESSEDYCKYRICQDGLNYLIPYMTKRVFYIDLALLKKLLKDKDIRHEEIDTENLRKQLSQTSLGCIVMIAIKSSIESEPLSQDNFIDAICCFNSPTRLSLMVSKEHQHIFNLKYDLE